VILQQEEEIRRAHDSNLSVGPSDVTGPSSRTKLNWEPFNMSTRNLAIKMPITIQKQIKSRGNKSRTSKCNSSVRDPKRGDIQFGTRQHTCKHITQTTTGMQLPVRNTQRRQKRCSQKLGSNAATLIIPLCEAP
jgi:hypothetical protein